MKWLAAGAIFLLLQDPIEVEAKFQAILERAEKAGLIVPDLPDAAAELETLSRAAKVPKELADRHTVVRAQATVLSTMHARLLKHKGGMLEIPLPPGKPVTVKIVELTRRGVNIDRQGIGQDIAYSELDPEWVLSKSREALSALPDFTLLSALWLAKAARWEAAFVALGELQTDHPLAAEARKRGVEAAAVSFDGLLKYKKWSELLVRLDAMEKFATVDERLTSIRSKTLDAMVEHGKELCRKGSKGPMKDIIDLITKHFPDGALRIEEIREASRWVKVTDPKRFRLEGIKGPPPWLIDPGEKPGVTMYILEVEEPYQALSVTIRFDKGSATEAGIAWKIGSRAIWIKSKDGILCGGQGEAAGQSITSEIDKPIPMDGKHTILLRVRDSEYVIQHNGVEIHRMESKERWITGMGLHVVGGKVWYDEVLLLKKE